MSLAPGSLTPGRLGELAERFGTPAYVYDLAAVRRAHRDLTAALPAGAVLHYSLKANPHPRLVAELAGLGCRAEVSSTGEVEVALAAGLAPEHLQLTGPGKTAATLAHALDHGVRRFSVDSPADLARVGELAATRGLRAECLLRVNADQPLTGMGLAMTGVASQFGADASWVIGRPEQFGGGVGARVIGMHLYAGTNLQDESALLRQFEVSVHLAAQVSAALSDQVAPVRPDRVPAGRPDLASEARPDLVSEVRADLASEVRADLVEVNLGGGFGTPYARAGDRPRFTGLASHLAVLLDGHLPGWRAGSPRISFESGRYLTGDSGTLLCQIVDVKVSKGRTFVVVDAGINHLGGMSGLRRVMPLVPTVDTLQTGGPIVRCSVVGPLCTTLDTLAADVPLADPRPGQLVAIPNVGAYGLTASLLGFLSHPAPAEVVIDGPDVVDVSRLHLTRSPLPPVAATTLKGD